MKEKNDMLVTAESSCICCNLLFLRETNGHCERFYNRELPRPTSGRSSCDFYLTDITSVTDVVSEQRCVVVAADAFVIVLGLQMFTKLLCFNPLYWFVF